jgi:hypothetical protein
MPELDHPLTVWLNVDIIRNYIYIFRRFFSKEVRQSGTNNGSHAAGKTFSNMNHT